MKSEKFGKDFINMTENEQISIVSACLVNSAKMIDSKANNGENGKKWHDAMKVLNENKTELVNETFLYCYERANNPKYSELPIALYVSKASGKALAKMVYQYSKSHDDIMDYENSVNCANCFESFQTVFDNERKAEIVDNIRNDIKHNCKAVIDLAEMGYSFSEIADMLGVSVKTVYKYVSAIVNSIALVNAIDNEWTITEKIIASDVSMKDSISRREIEIAIANIAKKKIPNYESIVNWNDFQTDRLTWLVKYLKSKAE